MLTMDDIGRRMEGIEGALSGLYLPRPGEAEIQRPRKSVKMEGSPVILRQDPNHVIIQGDQLWASSSLETHGFTHQDAFVGITVFGDSLQGNVLASWQPLFTIELQGMCGSPWTTLDSFVAVSNGRTGTFEVATLRAASSSLETRIVIYGADNVNWTAVPAAGRTVDFSVEGMLIAGYEM